MQGFIHNLREQKTRLVLVEQIQKNYLLCMNYTTRKIELSKRTAIVIYTFGVMRSIQYE